MSHRTDRLANEPPSQDPHYTTACLLKRRYTSRRDAKDAARRMRNLGRGHLVAYRCDYCDCWHLGNQRRNTTGA